MIDDTTTEEGRIKYLKRIYHRAHGHHMTLSNKEVEYLIHRGFGNDDIWSLGGERVGADGSLFNTIAEAAAWRLGYNAAMDRVREMAK